MKSNVGGIVGSLQSTILRLFVILCVLTIQRLLAVLCSMFIDNSVFIDST